MSEKKQFQAESRRLLDLMIHSIYTHREIFLRELLSNASDAIEKRSYLSLTEEKAGAKEYAITISIDKENRLLTVSDNGIGMDGTELEENLGVIAASGSNQFRTDHGDAADMIGQFGVGFYSAFMVADRITVFTKRPGATQGYRWESDGADGYTVSPCAKASVGTDIQMHIRPDGEEPDEYSQYLREYTIWKLVKKYSDYIRYPIRMYMPHPKLKEGCPQDAPEYEEEYAYETLNSMVPIWQRKKSEVTREEYDAFYREHYSDPVPPHTVLTAAVDGSITYKALLYIPGHVPEKYNTDEYRPGLQLYSAGVLIMDKCEALLPEYFNFVRGMVDSPDLSLNISREMLQHDRQLTVIAGNLEKKLRGELEKMKKDDREKYLQFYRTFGRQLKLCAMDDYGKHKDLLKDFFMFYSSTQKELTTLSEYVSRMKEGQKKIYYAAGENVTAIDNLPQTELLRDQGIEILYFTDKADEFITDVLRSYEGFPFASVVDSDLDLPGSKAKEQSTACQDTLRFIKDSLGGDADEVKPSGKLKTHPVCISSGEGISFEMERYFRAVQPEKGIRAKRILEINVAHPAFQALDRARLIEPEKATKYARILYNQALMIAGLPIENPSEYTDLICSLW